MGDVLSNVLGTSNQIGVNNANPLNDQDYQGELARGTGNYDNTVQGQTDLAKQLQAQANGTGPNPAQSMLQSAQAQNAQQAAGAYANNRAVNPALAARNASQMQGQLGAQSANQAATLGAQQQIEAQKNLGGLYNQMGNQALNYYGTTQGALNSANTTNAGLAAGNQQQAASTMGGVLGGVGAVLGMAKGGMVKGYAEGGDIGNEGPGSFAGQYFNSYGGPSGSPDKSMQSGMTKLGSGLQGSVGMSAAPEATVAGGAADAGGIEALAPMAMVAAHGGMAQLRYQTNMKTGGNVPGRASVKGNSYANDTVPAMLSPHEIVIPRSITTAKDAPEKAARFVRAVLAKNKGNQMKRKA